MAGEPEPDLTPEQMKSARKKFVDTSADHWKFHPESSEAAKAFQAMTPEEMDAWIAEHGQKPPGHGTLPTRR